MFVGKKRKKFKQLMKIYSSIISSIFCISFLFFLLTNNGNRNKFKIWMRISIFSHSIFLSSFCISLCYSQQTGKQKRMPNFQYFCWFRILPFGLTRSRVKIEYITTIISLMAYHTNLDSCLSQSNS